MVQKLVFDICAIRNKYDFKCSTHVMPLDGDQSPRSAITVNEIKEMLLTIASFTEITVTNRKWFFLLFSLFTIFLCSAFRLVLPVFLAGFDFGFPSDSIQTRKLNYKKHETFSFFSSKIKKNNIFSVWSNVSWMYRCPFRKLSKNGIIYFKNTK